MDYGKNITVNLKMNKKKHGANCTVSGNILDDDSIESSTPFQKSQPYRR